MMIVPQEGAQRMKVRPKDGGYSSWEGRCPWREEGSGGRMESGHRPALGTQMADFPWLGVFKSDLGALQAKQRLQPSLGRLATLDFFKNKEIRPC